MKRIPTWVWAVAVLSAPVGCSPSAHSFEPTPPPTPTDPPPAAEKGTSGHEPRGGGDAPEVTRSNGAKGGVVVFWPRVIPRSSDAETRDLAEKVQAKLADLVKKTLPDAEVDVRPEPERVCPKVGCAAMTVGALFTRNKNGCAVMALVSAPGTAPSRIVPWAGGVKIGQDTVGFREPPESQVKVSDFAACAKLVETMAQHDADVAAAIKAVPR